METIVPYRPGCLLGRSVDMRTFQPGYMLTEETISTTCAQVNLTECEFTYVTCLKDVCDILRVSPEYLLKVQGHVIEDEMISTCIDSIGDLRKSFSLIFRGRFLQQKQYLPGATMPKQNVNTNKSDEQSTESLIADAASDDPKIEQVGSKLSPTHWIKALEVGNEILVTLKISTTDDDHLRSLHRLIAENQGCYKGMLDRSKLDSLLKVAGKIDKKLNKKHYDDVKLDINYCVYKDMDNYPATLTGMVKVLQNFLYMCDGWTDVYKHERMVPKIEVRTMSCKTGTFVEEKPGIIQKISNIVSGALDPTSTAEADYQPDSETHDSFVVLASESDFLYFLRVTLESFDNEQEVDDAFTSIEITENPTDAYNYFDKLFILQYRTNQAVDKIQRFLRSKVFLREDRIHEGNEVLRSLQNIQILVHSTIKDLNLITMPSKDTLEDVLTSDPLGTVNTYIETVTSKLPPGGDIDLLLIGKTGHGKSSTGNSILGQKIFMSCADGESVTKATNIGWTNIDGRIVKAVDTPGVCDTNLATNEESISLAIRSISEAIAHCPNGFHALLLIVRYGTRMTDEEKKAISMLKCVLGEDIIRTHTICVVTYGDNYEKEEKKHFREWIKTQKGFLGELFKECNYRCVLMNNKADDPKVMKRQIIDLVNNVDSLKANGTRYTNAIFEFAQQERQRIIELERVPQVREDLMRDIQLVLENLNGMIHNTNEQEKYEAELVKLKETVDNLSNRMSEANDEKLGHLVDTVFSLAATIHVKMEEIADSPSMSVTDTEGAAAMTLTPQTNYNDTSSFQEQKDSLQKFVDNEVTPKAKEVDKKVTDAIEIEVKKQDHCFPAEAKVCLIDGRQVSMEDLQIGDKVLARNEKEETVFETVYMFGHRESEQRAHYKIIRSKNREIKISSEHLILCLRDGQEEMIAAKEVLVGDLICVKTDSNVGYEVVEEINQEIKRGMYAPFTMSGNIFVDGVLASCYIDLFKHKTSHNLLWPMRQLYKISPKCFDFVAQSDKRGDIPLFAKAVLKLTG